MLYDLTATAAYPPGQYPPEPIEPLGDDYVGLGFVPAIVAAPLVAAGTSAATGAIGGAVGGVTSFFGGLFGGGNPDTPSGWVENAYSGALGPCPTGRAQRTPPDVAGQIPPLFPSWREGYTVGPYDPGEVLAAVQAAPEGGVDVMGSRQGLIHALMYPAGPGTEANMRAPRNDTELARMAVYVAHGRKDCGVGWREEPAAAHLEAMVRQYRERAAQAAASPIAAWVASGPGGGITQLPGAVAAQLPELGEVARKNPVATIGVLVAVALGAGLLARTW